MDTKQQILREKITLLMVTLPSEYKMMLDNILESSNEALREVKETHNKFWQDIMDGKPKLYSSNSGKTVYEISASVKNDVKPDATIIFLNE